MSSFVRFAMVGAIGFAADAGLSLVLIGAGANPLAARLLSIPGALALTFLLNRSITFASRAPLVTEFRRYLAVNATGAGLNYLCFAAIVAVAPQALPILAIAAASLCALTFNYAGSKRFVFRPPQAS